VTKTWETGSRSLIPCWSLSYLRKEEEGNATTEFIDMDWWLYIAYKAANILRNK
jgi:hypothetical protein